MVANMHGESSAALVLLGEARAGNGTALRELVQALVPIVQARVARALLRSKLRLGRDVRQDVEDLTQDVVLRLLSDELKILRDWEPERGLSLWGFVGLVAERLVLSSLRSGRKSPWRDEPCPNDLFERAATHDDAAPSQASESRESLTLLLARLEQSLTPLGLEMFERLYVKEESITEICAQTGMLEPAVYAWKSRISKLARRLMADLDGQGKREAVSMQFSEERV